MIGLTLGVGWKINKKSSDGNIPVNVIPPVISGVAAVGETMSSTTGVWASDTGVTGYLYQWYRNGVPILTATSNTYVITIADRGTDITCGVAAIDSDGISAYVLSNSISIPALPSLNFSLSANSQYYSTYFY